MRALPIGRRGSDFRRGCEGHRRTGVRKRREQLRRDTRCEAPLSPGQAGGRHGFAATAPGLLGSAFDPGHGGRHEERGGAASVPTKPLSFGEKATMNATTIRRTSAWLVFVMVLTALAAGCGGADGGTDQAPASGEAVAEVGSALAGDPCTTAAQCNDGNPCTVDKCVKNACAYTNKSDGTTCSDGNACTKGDTCQAGACAGGPAGACAPPN